MAARRLVSFVHVGGEVYGPDSDVPSEVAKQISNPKAWGEEPEAKGSKASGRKPASSESE